MTREEFREIRKKMSLSQQAMADQLGLKYQQNVSRIEKKTGPSGPVAAHMRTIYRQFRSLQEDQNVSNNIA